MKLLHFFNDKPAFFLLMLIPLVGYTAPNPSISNVLFQTCTSVAPNYTETFTGTSDIVRSSDGNQYGKTNPFTGGCSRFVMDVNVLSGSGKVDLEGDTTKGVPLSPGTCADAKVDVTLYHNPTGSGFAFKDHIIKSGHFVPLQIGPTGQITPQHCYFGNAIADLNNPSGVYSNDIGLFRIAVKAYSASTGEKLPVRAYAKRILN